MLSTFDFRINEHVRLFISKKKSYLCRFIKDCAFINFEGKSNAIKNTLLFIFNLQYKFCHICHFVYNSIHLRPNLARFRKQIPKDVWEVCHPVCLFGPVRLFTFQDFCYLCAYLGLFVY